jgi:D-alanyl-D-alanine carboxypeptidase
MSRFIKFAILNVFIFCSLAGNNLQAQKSVIDDPAVLSSLKFLNAWIEARMAYDGWPGLSVGIVYDQDLLWSRGYGYADVDAGTPVDENTLFAIASNTKMFTAIAILKLRDDGKLQLDDPLEEYLPWFKNIQNPFPNPESITIRDILTHSSGLPSQAASANWTEFYLPPLEEIIAKLPEQSVTWPSDTRWKYSNLGASLLGAVVAAVAGTTYEEYVTSNILTPLGMSSTSYGPSGKLAEHMAIGYGRRMPDGGRDKMPICDLRGYVSAGGLWSSVNDLARFASWQFRLGNKREKEIVKTGTLKDMQQVHWLDSSWAFGWGLGFLIYHKEPCDLVGHGGSFPGYSTDFTVSPTEKIGVIVLANGADMKVYPDQANSISDRIFNWVVPALRNALAGTHTNQVDTMLRKYEGKYRYWGGDAVILNMVGGLATIDPLDPTDPDKSPKLVRIDKNVFWVETSDGFAAPGETLVFEENEKGEIVRYKHSGRVMERVANW